MPCPIILNNIILGEIDTYKKNNNLVFAQVFTQHPFTCATTIFGERKQNLVCHIWTLFHTINAWPISLESSVPWVTWVQKINVVFSTFDFIMHYYKS